MHLGIGIPLSSVQRGPSGPSASVAITGLTSNPTHGPTAQIGVELTATATFSGDDPAGGTWSSPWVVDGADFKIARYTPQTADDLDTLSATFTADDTYTPATSAAYTVRYPAPAASGSISDQNLVLTQAEVTVAADVTALFTGSDLSFGVSGYAGASLSAGALLVDPAAPVAGATVTLTATNSGGSADQTFALDVTALAFATGPSIAGTGKIGATHTATATANFAGTSISYDWLRDGVSIGSTDQATYVAQAADDLADLSCEVTLTKNGVSVSGTSNAVAITYTAPVAAGGIADQSYAQDSAISTLDVSSDFTGSGITYALAPSSASLPAGLSLASNGQITGTPTTEAAQVNIVVRGTNSGGFDDTAFGITITAASSAVDVEFGALTLAGDGGLAVPAGATGISNAGGTNLIYDSGFAVPDTGGGVSDGTVTFTGSSETWNVTSLANTYSAKPDKTEIEAAYNAASLSADTTCLVRAGSTDAEIDLTGRVFTGSFTLKGSGFSKNGYTRVWEKRETGTFNEKQEGYLRWTWGSQVGNILVSGENIHFEELEIYAPRSGGSTAAIYLPSAEELHDFSVKKCHIHGDHLGEMVELLRAENYPSRTLAEGNAIVATLPSGIIIPAKRVSSNGVVEDCYFHDFDGATNTDCDNYLFQGNMIRRCWGGMAGSGNNGATGFMFYHNEATDFFGGLPDDEDICSAHYGLGGGYIVDRSTTPESNNRIRAMGNVVNIGGGRQDYEVEQGRYTVTPCSQAGYTGFKKNDGGDDVNAYSGGFFNFNIFQLQNSIGTVLANADNEEIRYNTMIGCYGSSGYHEGGSPGISTEPAGTYAFQNTRIGQNMITHSVGWDTVETQLLDGEFHAVDNYGIKNTTAAAPTGSTFSRRLEDVFTGDATKDFGTDLSPAELIAAVTPKAGSYAATNNLGAVGPYLTLGIPGKGTTPTTPTWSVADSSGSADATGYAYPATVWDGTYGLALDSDATTGTAFNDGGAVPSSGTEFFVAWQGKVTGANTAAMSFMAAVSTRIDFSRPANTNRQAFFAMTNASNQKSVYVAPSGYIDADLGRVCIAISGDTSTDTCHVMINGRLFEINDYSTFEFADNALNFAHTAIRFFETSAGGDRAVIEHEALIFDNVFVNLKTNSGAVIAQDGFLRGEAAIDAALGHNPLAFIQGDAAAFMAGNGNALGRAQGVTVTNSGTVADVDTTAPTLSSPTDAADGATASTGSVSTNEGNGTLYWVVTTSATAPTAAQVKAGLDNSGSAATADGSQSVSGTGVQTLSPAPSGLTASTSYTTHFMHEDAATNQSAVSSASGFTTASGSNVDEGSSTATFTTSGGFRVAELTNGQTLVVSTGFTPTGIEMVGGGGGGGYYGGGGGGAGELIQKTTAVPALTAQTYTATVGAGGTGSDGTLVATNGGNTRLIGGSTDDLALTAIGGGAGGSSNASSPYGVGGGYDGGSGGASGGTGNATRNGVSIASDGVGNDGGDGAFSPLSGGGGGGSTGAGGNQSGGTGGTGGAGTTSVTPGKSETLAAGGAGGTSSGTSAGADATVFGCGGGGGDGSGAGTARYGGDGAAGIIRVWWPV